jgi:hypothetical protein
MLARMLWPVEIELYQPVKRFLEDLGFQVKGEIGGCDLFAFKAGEPPIVVIGELKLAFNLELVLQGVDRAAACDEVWLAVRAASNGRGRENDRRVRKLCRRLGFGLVVVQARGGVEIVVSPEEPLPRRDMKRRSRLMDEHRKRQGDPMAGGGSRRPIMTAYRQQALACASALSQGPRRVRDVKQSVPEAPKILQGNVYGWFVREGRGIYALTESGRATLEEHHVRERQVFTSKGLHLQRAFRSTLAPETSGLDERASPRSGLGDQEDAPHLAT